MSQSLTLASAIHLAAIVPAVALGVRQLVAEKGTRPHKILGWLWIVAMTIAAISSFWIMEQRKGAGWSWIHLLSVWVLACLCVSIWQIRRGNVRAHKRFMIGVFVGVIAAGAGALMPGRFLAHLLF